MAQIRTVAELREIYRTPSERAQRKQLDALDAHCRAFIALSPFVVLASSSKDGVDARYPEGRRTRFRQGSGRAHAAPP